MLENNQAIAITNDYPADKFNSLIPVKTMQELSPLHKIVFNQVQISPNTTDGDVYKQGNGLALTKKALMKLMTAANIQVVESISVDPAICIKCHGTARATKLAPRCGDCPSKNDVAYKVTVASPDPSGTPRYFQGSKNSRYEDATSSTEKKFLAEQCESKALNRALRGAMMIKSVYTAEELKKPFVIALVVLNMADEDLKKVMVSKYADSSTMLFGTNPTRQALNAPSPIAEEEIIIVPDDEVEENENIETVEVEIVEEVPQSIGCGKCGQVIEGIDEQWTVDAIIEYSKKKFKGKVLCADCQKETLEAFKKANAAREANK
jgi:hypothetical protein